MYSTKLTLPLNCILFFCHTIIDMIERNCTIEHIFSTYTTVNWEVYQFIKSNSKSYFDALFINFKYILYNHPFITKINFINKFDTVNYYFVEYVANMIFINYDEINTLGETLVTI